MIKNSIGKDKDFWTTELKQLKNWKNNPIYESGGKTNGHVYTTLSDLKLTPPDREFGLTNPYYLPAGRLGLTNPHYNSTGKLGLTNPDYLPAGNLSTKTTCSEHLAKIKDYITKITDSNTNFFTNLLPEITTTFETIIIIDTAEDIIKKSGAQQVECFDLLKEMVNLYVLINNYNNLLSNNSNNNIHNTNIQKLNDNIYTFYMQLKLYCGMFKTKVNSTTKTLTAIINAQINDILTNIVTKMHSTKQNDNTDWKREYDCLSTLVTTPVKNTVKNPVKNTVKNPVKNTVEKPGAYSQFFVNLDAAIKNKFTELKKIKEIVSAHKPSSHTFLNKLLLRPEEYKKLQNLKTRVTKINYVTILDNIKNVNVALTNIKNYMKKHNIVTLAQTGTSNTMNINNTQILELWTLYEHSWFKLCNLLKNSNIKTYTNLTCDENRIRYRNTKNLTNAQKINLSNKIYKNSPQYPHV